MNYNMQSRGYKTKGYEYKDRYVYDKVCPECGGTSIYKDEWNTITSYKCIKRSCRYQWYENKNKEYKNETKENKFEEIKINEEEKKKQESLQIMNHYIMTVDLNSSDRKDSTLYSLIGHYDTSMTKVLGNQLTFEEVTKCIRKHKDDYENFNIIEEKMIGLMPSNLYVISNAESYLEETKEILYRPLALNETFIFNGNFIGNKNFLKYSKYLLFFKGKRPCIFIRGKNEHNILEYINGTEQYIGENVLLDFILPIEEELNGQLKNLERDYPAIYKLLNDTKDYFENDTHIVVSGGVNLSIPFWKQSSKSFLYNTTEEFLNYENYTGKTIVFGDMPIEKIDTSTKQYGIWQNKKQNKIGINGNVKNGDKLIALSILDNDVNYISIKNKKAKRERLLTKYTLEELEEMNREISDRGS